jgi:LmbE family N-acetylglucosaminyl deacetylase/tetratricopeptide (TPR) repeat protein
MPASVRPALAALLVAVATAAVARPPPGSRLGQPPGGPLAVAFDAVRRDRESLRRYAGEQAQAGRYAEAIQAYERILGLEPGDTDALAHAAQLHAWTGDYDRSIVLYRQALALRPKDLGLQSDLADVLTWAKRLEEAERLYEAVLVSDPDHHEALKGLARARLLHGDVAAAAEVLDRALKLYPGDVDLHRERARMLSQKGDLDGAVASLERAVLLAPSDAEVERHLAETFQRKRDWPRAVDAWLKVSQLAPDQPGPNVELARAYLALGKRSLAQDHAALALRLSPNDPAARQLLADMDREAGLLSVRSLSDWFVVLAYLALLPLAILVARRVHPALRRRPVAWIFVAWVAPGFILLNAASHLARGWLTGRVDLTILDSVSEIAIFLGLFIAFLALLRSGPPMREVSGEVVLALGAHPDDIELGCAGFLLKLKSGGARVYGLTMTRGEKGTDRDGDREAEARKAAEFLGLDGYWVLDFPDTGLQDRVPDLKHSIEARIRELGATLVLTHTEVDVHGDHRAVHAATREAARAVPTVLCYEDVSTGNHFTPDLYVDISHHIEDHLRACALHRTQDHRSYMDPQVIQGRAAHRGLQIGASFALAFRTLRLVR